LPLKTITIMKKILFCPTHRFIICVLLLFSFFNIHAQRLEVHAIKDFSNDENANKAWGVGGTIELDQLVKNFSLRINFDWATYRKKDDITNPNYQRMGGGAAVCYSLNITEKLIFQCGVGINYIHLKHSWVYDTDTLQNGKLLTVLQQGNFIGIGTHIGIQYKLSPRFNVALNLIPEYLIRVNSKSSVLSIEPEYNKGIWLFPIQLGLSFQLFKPD